MAQNFKSGVNIDGSVGIGLTSPLDDLHVNTYGTGGIRIQADVTPAPVPVDAHIKFFSGTSNLAEIRANLSNGLQIYETGTHVLTVDGTNGVDVLVGALSLQTGSATSPALNFVSNGDTGIYGSNSNSTISFASDGEGAMFIRNYIPAANTYIPRVGIGGVDDLTTGHALHITTGTAVTNTVSNLKVLHLGETQDSGLSIRIGSNGTNADDKVSIMSPGNQSNTIAFRAGEFTSSTDGDMLLEQYFGNQSLSLNTANSTMFCRLNIGERTDNSDTFPAIGFGGNTGTYGITKIGMNYNYAWFYNANTSTKFAFINSFGFGGGIEDSGGADVFVGRLGVGETQPAIAIDAGNKTDAIKVPNGTTAQRPTGAAGMIRYNTTDGAFEGYINSWEALGSTEPAPSTVNQNGGSALQYWSGTQAQYDSISTPDSNTIYFIT